MLDSIPLSWTLTRLQPTILAMIFALIFAMHHRQSSQVNILPPLNIYIIHRMLVVYKHLTKVAAGAPQIT